MLTPKSKIVERLTAFVEKYWILPDDCVVTLPAMLQDGDEEGSLSIPVCISFANGCGTFSSMDLHWMWRDDDTNCIFSILAPSATIGIDQDYTLNLSKVQITIEDEEKQHLFHLNNQEQRIFAKIESIILTKRNSPTASVDQYHTLLECDHFTISGVLDPTMESSKDIITIAHVMKVDCAMVIGKGLVDIKNILPKELLESILTPHACTCEIRVRSFRMVNMKPTLRDFDPLPAFTGDENTNLYKVICHLLEFLPEPQRRLNAPLIGISDSMAATAGCIATGASFVTPLGAAVAVAAVGAKDGIVSAAQVGKASRGGAETDSYRVGDVTRGVIHKIKSKKSNTNSTERGNPPGQEQPSSTDTSKYAAIVGSSVGAAVGLALAGPVGFVAGSLVGGQTAKKAMDPKNNNEQDQQETNNGSGEASSSSSSFSSPAETSKEIPYRIGDNIRKVVAQGKQADGRDVGDNYKFGDFTRGLLNKGRQNIPQQPQELQTETNYHRQSLEFNTPRKSSSTNRPYDNFAFDSMNTRQNMGFSPPPNATTPPPSSTSSNINTDTNTNSTKPYRLGDNIRRIVAKGKHADGRDSNDKYQFGDFTRGLVNSKSKQQQQQQKPSSARW